MTNYLLGIDIGSYESKGVLTTSNGDIVAQHILKHKLDFIKPGHVEHDAEGIWWSDFCEIAKVLSSAVNPSEIKGIGVSCVFSMLPVDEENNPLREGGILYGVDTRSQYEIEQINARFGEDTIFEACGNTLSSQSMGPKIEWLKNNEPEIHKKSAAFLHGASFIVARLTGKRAMSHFDAAFYAPLYDSHRREWNPDMCRGICDFSQLPQLKWASEIAGYITEKGSLSTGLAVGTPVTTGVSDAATEALSVGVHHPGNTMLMYGSTAWMTLITDAPFQDRSLWSSPFLFPDTFCLHAGILTSGSLTRWMRDLTAHDILGPNGQGDDDAYRILSDEAAKILPGSDGLIVLPYFSGASSPVHNPKARGILFGLDLSHQRGHLYRATIEGLSCGITHCLNVMKSAGAEVNNLVAVGGGTKNATWLQTVSDISKIKQEICETTFGASYGDAFLGGLASGVIQDRSRIKEWISVSDLIEPDPNNAEIYADLLKKYHKLYQSTLDLL